jgi:hypothetical protein
VAPVKVGGSANAGAGRLASAFDHVHPLTETSGPTDLTPGSIIDTETVRRVGALLVGQQFDSGRQAGGQGSTSTDMTDIGTPFVWNIRRTGGHMFLALLSYSTALVTTGLRLNANFTGTFSTNGVRIFGATGPAALVAANAAWGTPLGSAGVGPGNVSTPMLVYGSANITAIGTLSLQFASGVAGSNVNIDSSSWGVLIQQ